MKKEKIKQIILITLSIVFIGIGFLNFNNQYKSVEVATSEYRNELNLGDVQLVNSEASNEVEKEYLVDVVSNEGLENLENSVAEETSNEILAEQNTEISSNLNKQENNQNIVENNNLKNEDQYFVETKLQRDTMYSEMLETYQKMIENPDVGETQKAIATQEITNINNSKNGIMIAENLIKNKGFEDVAILVNNGTVSVVIKASLLNEEQISKIQNIVSRELNVTLENIYISKK